MRFKGTVAYDGTDFFGWQSQVGGNTIQDIIEKRLSVIFSRPIRVQGSSRTDSGVHARDQVFHFDADWRHPVPHLHNALRTGFPDSIQIVRINRVPDSFHARYSAKGKRYKYRLYAGYAPPFETRYMLSLGRRQLDLDVMREAAASLTGQHDFRAFAAEGGTPLEPQDYIKDLRKLDISRQGPRITITTEASGYLYKMVRSLVGALLDVGWGKLKPADLAAIRESRQRTALIVTAPARGLCLEKVYY